MSDTHLRDLFSTAYILGGSPCSGKSSLAGRLSEARGLPYYRADDYDGRHFARSCAQAQPVMTLYAGLSWDEIWSREPARLLADELAIYREAFPMILDDLLSFGASVPAVLEGAAFLPELIRPWVVDPSRVVLLVPTRQFQERNYRRRAWIGKILENCHNPALAFEHWMERDELFGREVLRQAQACGYEVTLVDGATGLDEQYSRLLCKFRLGEARVAV